MIKQFISFILISILVYITLSCANKLPLTGGAKDTIPPSLIYSDPEHGAVNIKQREMYFEYDEWLLINNMKEQLIITPYIDNDYDLKYGKKHFKLIFEMPFEDSTTYTLNFREAIQDITEKNPAKDNKISFSTGDFIDSIYVKGYTFNLLTGDTLTDIMVGLYQLTDTLNPISDKPYYFSESDEEGHYSLENIKPGYYRMYAYLDDNKNLKNEPDKEISGLISDTLKLLSPVNFTNLHLLYSDYRPLQVLTAVAISRYFEINFNKPIYQYDIKTVSNNRPVWSNTFKEGKSIRIYNTFGALDGDSIAISVESTDSAGYNIAEIMYAKFRESKRSPETFSMSPKIGNGSKITTNYQGQINFNKPVKSINCDSIYFLYDSTIINSTVDSIFEWNDNKTEVKFNIDINKILADTVRIQNERKKQQQKEKAEEKKAEEQTGETKTLQDKSAYRRNKNQRTDKTKQAPKIEELKGLQLYIGKTAFMSIEDDTLATTVYRYEFADAQKSAIVGGTVQCVHDYYFVQILTEDFELVDEIYGTSKFRFSYLKPGKYRLRVLVDNNKNGVWDKGNLLKDVPPEDVFIHPAVISVKELWELDDVEIVF